MGIIIFNQQIYNAFDLLIYNNQTYTTNSPNKIIYNGQIYMSTVQENNQSNGDDNNENSN